MSIAEGIDHWRKTLRVGTEVTTHTGEVLKVTNANRYLVTLGVICYSWQRVEQLFRVGAFNRESIKAPALKANEYQCEACLGVFEFGWSEAEALAEANGNFPTLQPEDRAIICDTCYKKMMS